MLQCGHCNTVHLKDVGETKYGFRMYACWNCGALYTDPSYFKPRKEATIPKTGNGGDWTKRLKDTLTNNRQKSSEET